MNIKAIWKDPDYINKCENVVIIGIWFNVEPLAYCVHKSGHIHQHPVSELEVIDTGYLPKAWTLTE